MPLHMRIPKRGFNNIFAKDYAEVNLGMIQKLIDAKQARCPAVIDHAALKAAGVGRGGKDGVRLLGKGEFKAKLSFKVAGVSRAAVEAPSRRPAVRSNCLRRSAPAKRKEAARREANLRLKPARLAICRGTGAKFPGRRVAHYLGGGSTSPASFTLYVARGYGLTGGPSRCRAFRQGSPTIPWHHAPTNGEQSDLANFSKATELKKRIWFTLGALIVFRFLSFVPLPGVNPLILEGAVCDRRAGGILDLFNTFSGGSLERMSLIALGVMPYITASIVVQLAASLSPTLAALKKEGESGRKKLNQYTRYGTVLLTRSRAISSPRAWRPTARRAAFRRWSIPAYMFRVSAVISLIGGTMFLLWLGEQITSAGSATAFR
jgi:hypothetical protein